jgi:hypothetical protein
MKSRSQLTMAGTGFEKYTKTTRRAQFLAEMDRVVPWRGLCARIERVYPKPGNGSAADRRGAHAADVLPSALVQFVRSRRGRGVVRLPNPAGLRGDRSGARAGAVRNDGLQVPPSARRARLGQAMFDAVTQHLRAHGNGRQHGHHRGRHHYRGALVDEERDGYARSGDASDEERPAVVFRDERPLRGRQSEQAHSLSQMALGSCCCRAWICSETLAR